jgi:chloramphenicol 3-O phosphotransferase
MAADLPGRVIVLNGCGSVGKNSIAKALQAITKEPFLHLQGDAFLEMLPARIYGHSNGIIFEKAKS